MIRKLRAMHDGLKMPQGTPLKEPSRWYRGSLHAGTIVCCLIRLQALAPSVGEAGGLSR